MHLCYNENFKGVLGIKKANNSFTDLIWSYASLCRDVQILSSGKQQSHVVCQETLYGYTSEIIVKKILNLKEKFWSSNY